MFTVIIPLAKPKYVLKYKAVQTYYLNVHALLCALDIRITNWSCDFPYKITAFFLQVKFIHGVFFLMEMRLDYIIS